MSKKLAAAVLAALTLDVLITGYGTLAAGQEAQQTCAKDHGVVRDHECMKEGRDLFHVPL